NLSLRLHLDQPTAHQRRFSTITTSPLHHHSSRCPATRQPANGLDHCTAPRPARNRSNCPLTATKRDDRKGKGGVLEIAICTWRRSERNPLNGPTRQLLKSPCKPERASTKHPLDSGHWT